MAPIRFPPLEGVHGKQQMQGSQRCRRHEAVLIAFLILSARGNGQFQTYTDFFDTLQKPHHLVVLRSSREFRPVRNGELVFSVSHRLSFEKWQSLASP
jgi:hypothetical protein